MILLPFPFSDLSASKLRPALLLAEAGNGAWLLCQITSNPYANPRAVTLAEDDFGGGGGGGDGAGWGMSSEWPVGRGLGLSSDILRAIPAQPSSSAALFGWRWRKPSA